MSAARRPEGAASDDDDVEQEPRDGTTDAPDMTTGMSDFMIRSGRNWPRPEIPMPDLAVP